MVAGDARAALMAAPPIHIALNHPALLPSRPKPRIAFLQVSQTPTTKALVDQAIAALTRKGFEVLDRENIDRILKEQKFHGGELVDLDQQVQLGKIMGVTDLVAVDAATLAGGPVRVSFKALDITTARVLRLVKDVFPDPKNAGRALAGFFLDWNEVYDLRLGPCPALESGEYGSLAATYQLVVDAVQSAPKVEALAQVPGSHSAGKQHSYGSTYSVSAWSGEPEDSPRRGAYLVYEAYVEHQLGLLYLRLDKLDAALGHLQQAALKIDKSNWDAPESDQLTRDIFAARAVVQRLKTEREAAEE
jgi:hypothetical protein